MLTQTMIEQTKQDAIKAKNAKSTIEGDQNISRRAGMELTIDVSGLDANDLMKIYQTYLTTLNKKD